MCDMFSYMHANHKHISFAQLKYVYYCKWHIVIEQTSLRATSMLAVLVGQLASHFVTNTNIFLRIGRGVGSSPLIFIKLPALQNDSLFENCDASGGLVFETDIEMCTHGCAPFLSIAINVFAIHMRSVPTNVCMCVFS